MPGDGIQSRLLVGELDPVVRLLAEPDRRDLADAALQVLGQLLKRREVDQLGAQAFDDFARV